MSQNASPPTPVTGPQAASRKWLWVALALFVVTRGLILLPFKPAASDAYGLYVTFAVRGVDLGKVPYKDFDIEYPPVAWWSLALPRWIDPAKLTARSSRHEREKAQVRYHQRFRYEMFLCELVAFGLVVTTLRRRRPELAGPLAVAYVIALAVLAHLLYDRLDAGLLLLLAIWAYAWTRSHDSNRAAWVFCSYAALGLSVSFKLVPVLMTPFLLLAEWHAPRRWRNLTIALAALLIGTIGPFVVHYPSSGLASLNFLKFHAGRGLQLETLPSSLLLLTKFAGAPLKVDHPYGGFDLDFPPWSLLAKQVTTGLLLLALAGLGLAALIKGRQFTRERAYQCALYSLSLSVILAPVLSPQYFVWAIPLILLLAAERFPSAAGPTALLGVMLIVMTLLSTWLFPYHYYFPEKSPDVEHALPVTLVALDAAPIIVLAVRNALYLALISWLAVWLFRNPRKIV